MVYEVRWSPDALKDVKGIADHIRKDSERYAEIVADKIIGIARKIEKFPKAGHMTPEFGSDAIRERTIYSYRVIYRIRGNQITIAAVVHGKQLLSSFNKRFE